MAAIGHIGNRRQADRRPVWQRAGPRRPVVEDRELQAGEHDVPVGHIAQIDQCTLERGVCRIERLRSRSIVGRDQRFGGRQQDERATERHHHGDRAQRYHESHSALVAELHATSASSRCAAQS
jgi:hypothetical protein